MSFKELVIKKIIEQYAVTPQEIKAMLQSARSDKMLWQICFKHNLAKKVK